MYKSQFEMLPLSTAQRGIWITQKISPSANMNIAEAVEIMGEVDPDIFRRALWKLVEEAEQLRVGISEENGKPLQFVREVYARDFPYIDLSGEADPERAAYSWMNGELSGPVDLAHDALWVSALIKVKDHQYFWYQRAHHIIFDGYGGSLVVGRLAELYAAYSKGSEAEDCRFSTVREVIDAESSYRASERFRRDRKYWSEQLANLPKAVTLSRRASRHGLSSDLRRSSGQFPVEMIRRLASLGRESSASLPQVLISLVIAYYQRATGAKDLVVGMPVSGRMSPVLKRSLTVSANVLPIRVTFTPGMRIGELFKQVSQLVRQGLRRQQYRYEDMRRDLGLVGQSQNLAWLGVNIEPFDYSIRFGDADSVPHNLSNSAAEDLMVFVYDRGTESDLCFDLDANPALYDECELNEHRRRLRRLADEVLAHPETPLERLDVLGDEERGRLLRAWNDTEALVPDSSIPKLIEQHAMATPDAPALIYEETVVTYGELQRRSVEQAWQLVADGVKPGDIVAVALPRNERLPIVLLGIMRAGAAYLPVDLDGPIERTMMVLEDASPAALFADARMHSNFAGLGCRLLEPEQVTAEIEGARETVDLTESESVAYVLYTSGSTGRPKGVEVTHRNLSNFIDGMRRVLKPDASNRYLAVTTITFDIAGLEIYIPLVSGGSVTLASSKAVHNPPQLAKLLRQSRITHMQATPSLWRVLLASPEVNLEDVHALVGGESLSAKLAARLKSRSSRVTQFYGPTETTVWSTAYEIEKVGSAPPPIGHPIVNTQLYVLDEALQPVMTGAIGELFIGGEGVAKGYLNRPELTAERFLPDPFSAKEQRMYRTGDLVRWNDGGALEFVGRADQQIKINGHRLELGEIESQISQFPSVAHAAVAAHRIDEGMVSLAGYVVAADGAKIDVQALRTFLTSRLPGYMLPSNIMLLEALPLTPNGKLDRKALPIPERAVRRLYAEPVTPTERKLAALWQQILNLEQVGLHDNFFDLGGDSLRAAELAAVFPSAFDRDLPLGSVFEAPTIAELAAVVERLTGQYADPLSLVLPLRTVELHARRPLFCVHPIAGLSLSFSSLLRHLDPRLPVYGLQSRGLCDGAGLPGSIEEIAADYLEQIQRIQPRGPYRIIGRSLGGLIAHSMAEQMQAKGLQVELLAMIDSYLFTAREHMSPLTEADEVRAVLKFLDVQLAEDRMPASIPALSETLKQIYSGRDIPVAREIMKQNPQFMQHAFAVMLNNMQLARRHVPGRVNQNLLYFHAAHSDLQDILGHGPSAWRSFMSGRIEVHELDCDHEEVLSAAPAAVIGSVLTDALSVLDEDRVADTTVNAASAVGSSRVQHA